MKKVTATFYLCFFLLAFVYSQSEADMVCNSHLENIFKTLNLKIRYEAVQHLYQESKNKDSFLRMDSKEMWGYYFGLIRGFPLDFNIDSLVKRTPASDEDMNNYIEHLNCTPEQAFKEYKDFILNIKSEKEIYLKCIDTELAKGDSSKYTKNSLFYNFHYPWSSILAPVGTKLDFLKVFKEFVLNDNEEVLPDKYRVLVFLRNCLFVQN